MWLIFDTHPIQYRSPVFRRLHEQSVDFHVVYLNESFNSHRWWFRERGKSPRQNWNLELTHGFPSSCLHLDATSFWSKFRLLQRTLKQYRPKAVAYFGYYLWEHWFVWILCAAMRIPVVFIGETFEQSPETFRGLVQKLARRLHFSQVAQFVSIGIKNENYYHQLGIARHRISAARYCTDNTFFYRPDEAQALRQKWRTAWQIPDEAFVVLFVGRLFDRKRPFDVLEVAAKTRNKMTYFCVVGNGPLEEPLHRAAAGRSNLRFLGFQDQIQTRSAYYGADFLYVPSEFETWGLVVNEAASCGRASLVTPRCGVANDLAIDGRTAFVVAVGDTDTAAERIDQLAKDRSMCSRMGENAQALVLSSFGVDQFATALVNALKLASGRRDLKRQPETQTIPT